MKAILGTLFLLACATKVSLEGLPACVDCAYNDVGSPKGNEIMGSIFSVESNQIKRNEIEPSNSPTPRPVEEFEEKELIQTTTVTNVEAGQQETPQVPEEHKPSGKFGHRESHKRKKVKSKGKNDLQAVPQSMEPTPQTTEHSNTIVMPEGSKGVEDLVRGSNLVLTTGPENAPELIEDAPMKHGSLDAMRIYEAENPKPKQQVNPSPTIPNQELPSHPIFMKYEEHDVHKPVSGHQRVEIDSSESSEEFESEESLDPDKDEEPKCFAFSDIFKGAGKMASGFWKKEGLQKKFGVVGRTIQKAAKSVAACAHSVWNGVHHFVGKIHDKIYDGDEKEKVNFSHTIKKKSESAKEKVHESNEEEGVLDKTRRWAEEAGDKVKEWFTKKRSSVGPDEKRNN